MKDLRIVIVSWNVEKLLERCLASLSSACSGLSWDVVVVDNASRDKSVEVANQARNEILRQTQDDKRMTVIANSDNRGFAKATNQGINGQDARYVLLLNPDTECPPNSLRDFVREADGQPKAGILGPRLTYPGGSTQPSVRRFPTVWSQLGILLKLHHLVPWLPTFKRYFGDKVVDQVMGACFLIRRELLDQLGGLDERYFIWFEEVDYCRQAKKQGWEIRFVPSVTVIHHGGQSFAQVFSTAKQRMFNRSLLAYFQKWHPGWRTWLLHAASPISIGLSAIVQCLQTSSGRITAWMVFLVFLDVISLATVFNPLPRAIATIVFGIGLFVISIRRPDIGLATIALELAVGSKGALLKIPNGNEVDGGISLRIVLFGAFFAGWLVSAWRSRHTLLRHLRDHVRVYLPWFALMGLVVLATVRGAMLNPETWQSDVNAWLFLGMLFPVLDVAIRDGKRLISSVSEAIIAALLWLPIKTLLLLYVWSHGIKSLSQPLYLWVRRTGVGEVTLVVGNLFRVFIQSQIYAIAGLFASAAYLLDAKEKQGKRLAFAIVVGATVSIAIGLSRSFWIGCFAGLIAFLFLSFLRRQESSLGRPAIRGWIPAFAGMTVGAGILGLVLIAATIFFPVPRVDTTSLATLFGSRGSISDPAAASRWNLLPVLGAKIKTAPILGSGFGATVTYQSKDPRILAQHPDGMYTTYAFEWGWLEHWIKFGILGIPVMAWLVISLMIRAWKTNAPWWLRAGFVSTLVALATLHIFTPYLNHPLGFGLLFLAEGWITASRSSIPDRSSASRLPVGR